MALYKYTGENKSIIPVPKGCFLYKDSYCTFTQRELEYGEAYLNFNAPLISYSSSTSQRATWVLVNPESLNTLKFKKHANAQTLTVKAVKKDSANTVETISLDSNDVADVTNPSQYALVYASTGGSASTVYLKMAAT